MNLHISAIEVRSDDDADVRSYTHARTMETVVIPLSPVFDEVRVPCMQLDFFGTAVL